MTKPARTLVLAALALSAAACASRDAGRDVRAMVQDETARQAAATAAQSGEDSKAAVAAGADAAAARDPGEPPT